MNLQVLVALAEIVSALAVVLTLVVLIISIRQNTKSQRALVVDSLAAAGDSFTHAITTPAWKSKPSWYMVATADRSINPDQERTMAKRANAKTIEVNSSHVAYISHPKETAKLIEQAATSATVKQ